MNDFDALDEHLVIEHDWKVVLVQSYFQDQQESIYEGPIEYKARRELEHVLDLAKTPEQFQKTYGCAPSDISSVLLCCDDKIEVIDSWLNYRE